jgi:hypothetical protein
LLQASAAPQRKNAPGWASKVANLNTVDGSGGTGGEGQRLTRAAGDAADEESSTFEASLGNIELVHQVAVEARNLVGVHLREPHAAVRPDGDARGLTRIGRDLELGQEPVRGRAADAVGIELGEEDGVVGVGNNSERAAGLPSRSR